MSVPQTPIPPSGAGPTPGRRTSVAAVLMVIVGIVLLLPGLCALYFVAGFAITEPQNLFKFTDPIQNMILVLWGICFAIALVGALLLRAGWRRR
jgi:hypothetical protein